MYLKNEKIILSISLLVITFLVQAQQTTLKVVNKNLTLTNGQTVVLRGINYPILDQGDISLSDATAVHNYIDQVALTGANCIRIPWYTDGQSWRDKTAQGGKPGTVNGYVQNGDLDNLLAYCITKGMIPVLEIHDDANITCKVDWNYFNTTVMNFWTNPVVVSIINNNKARIIINLANEFDKVRWSAMPQATALNTYKTNYNAAIASIRNAGINVPIMIDAPDCGQSSTELLSIAESMNTSDSQHNLIFSSHAYWAGYASTLAQVQTKLNEAQSKNVCFVLGEIANNQDENGCGDLGLYTLYPQILTEACSRNIGWLAWSFNHDCTQYTAGFNNTNYRVISTTSNTNNLTTFGNDIINNLNYGLKSISGCGATNLLSNSEFVINSLDITIYPNPSQNTFIIKTPQKITKITAFNVLGKQIPLNFVSQGQYNIKQRGVYLLNVELENGSVIHKKIIIE
jgi:mannan endo-1,4-beta-mannosidase